MIIRKISLLLFVVIVTSCTTITGKDKIQSYPISEMESKNILITYMKTNNITWGEPTFMAISPPKYVYQFSTPADEIPKLGKRIIMVDVNTGEVSIPVRF